MIAQDEEIYLDDKCTRDNLVLIADAMGYCDSGAETATDFLLADYYYHTKQAKDSIRQLLPYAVVARTYLYALSKDAAMYCRANWRLYGDLNPVYVIDNHVC